MRQPVRIETDAQAMAASRSTSSTYICETRCGSSAALHEPVRVRTISRAACAEGRLKRASSCVV